MERIDKINFVGDDDLNPNRQMVADSLETIKTALSQLNLIVHQEQLHTVDTKHAVKEAAVALTRLEIANRTGNLS